MDKARILRSANRSKIMNNLNPDETRLYLILLASCGEDGDGKILLRVINGVLGEGFTAERLKAACSRLAEYGLIEVSPSSLAQGNDIDAKLAYKIFPVEGR